MFGKDVYAMHSKLCVAAAHAGVLTPAGGEFLVTVVKPVESYESAEQNGL